MVKAMDNLCRTCLLYSEQHSFIDSEASEIRIVSIFVVPEVGRTENLSLRDLMKTSVPQLEIKENDQLPKNICNKCMEKIIDIYNFQLKCLKNEETIYKLLELGDTSSLFNNSKNPLEIVVKNEQIDNLYDQKNSIKVLTTEKISEGNSTEDDSNSSDGFMCDVKTESNSIDLITTENIIEDNIISTDDDTNRSDDFMCDVKTESDVEESKLNIEKEKSKTRTKKTLKKKLKRTYSKCRAKSKQNNSKELYSCGKCQRKLKSELSLMKHHELHLKKDKEEKELKCNICNKAFPEITTFRNHQQTHTSEKTFLCSECGKGFTSAGSLKQHSFRHLDKKLYPCSDCPKSFPTNGDLLCHYEIHKAKPRIHVCDVCGRGFHKPFLLKQHQRYHNNERPFACEFCEKRFVTSEKQRRHIRTHTGEKPYRCKYCDRAFAQSNDCIKHLRQHLGDNVYQCELCPLRFPLARDLRLHFASHKDDDDETRSRNLRARIDEENNLQIKLS